MVCRVAGCADYATLRLCRTVLVWVRLWLVITSCCGRTLTELLSMSTRRLNLKSVTFLFVSMVVVRARASGLAVCRTLPTS